MLTTCPQCQTKFNVPDAVYQPGRKARCSVCSFVFPLPPLDVSRSVASVSASTVSPPPSMDSPSQEMNGFFTPADASPISGLMDNLPGFLDGAPGQTGLKQDAGFSDGASISMMPPKPVAKRRGIFIIAIIVCLLALSAGGFLLLSAEHERGVDEPKDIVAEEISGFDKIKNISLIGLKQYYVDNERMGALVVIEGRARNDFDTPKSYITLEAMLYDADGKVVATQQQYCGIQLEPRQLSVYGKADMVKALTNKFEILAANVNVKPGSESPFMLVFMYPPTNISKFAVRVVDAKDSPDPSGVNVQ